MADLSKPDSLSLYSAVWSLYQAVITSIATMFDRTSDTNIPDKAKRYNTSTNKFQTYSSSGGTWANLGFHSPIDSHIADTYIHSSAPVGVVFPFAGAAGAVPAGFLLCDGSEIDRTTFSGLFAVIGTTYGIGNGSTTFNIPNLQQRFILGKGSSGTGSGLGELGGSIDHTHSVPAHTHSISAHTHTMGNHTHSIPSHQHNTPAHEHTVPPHGHSCEHLFASLAITGAGGSHSHNYGVREATSVSGSSVGNRAARAVEGSGNTDNNTTSTTGSTHTHNHSEFTGTVGAWNGGGTGTSGDGNFSTSGYGGGTTDFAPSATSGTPSTNTTDSGGPTSTGSGGSGTSGSNNPKYIALNHIIRI